MVLFLMFIFFIAVSLVYLVQQKYSKPTLLMLGMGFSYLFVVSSIIIYLSKDAFYYNSLYKYFGITQSLQNQLLFLPISRDTLLRLFNGFSMSYIYCSLAAAILFAFHLPPRRQRILLIVLAIPGLAQFVWYDPRFYASLYYRLYPDYLSAQGIAKLYDAVHILTVAANNLAIAAGVVLFIYTLAAAPRVRQIRTNILTILLCYLSIQITYSYINYWAPDLLVTVSKAAHFVRYKPINLYGSPFMYTLLPYISTLGLLISVYAIYRYSKMQNSIKNHEAVISRNIDSALLTSRVFSHYLKNEMLAIMAQTEFLEMMCEKSPDTVKEIRVIEERCRNIYARLDDVHRKALKSKMDLKPIRILPLVEDVIERMRPELAGISCTFGKRMPEPLVMADAYYLAQAVEQVLHNAREALQAVNRKPKQIHIAVHVRGKWVEISVQDNGPGIAEDVQEQMFEPFYSSKPTSTNWGMGLSICRSILSSHEGKIRVESTVGKGTSFYMIIPLFSIYDYRQGEGHQASQARRTASRR